MTDMQILNNTTNTLTGDEVVHLVDFTDAPKTPRVMVLEARAEGSMLQGVCGQEFTPQRNPKMLTNFDNCCRDCKVALIDLTHDQMMKSWWTQ